MATTANEPEDLANRASRDSGRDTSHGHMMRTDDETIVEIGIHPNRPGLLRQLGVVEPRDPCP